MKFIQKSLLQKLLFFCILPLIFANINCDFFDDCDFCDNCDDCNCEFESPEITEQKERLYPPLKKQ